MTQKELLYLEDAISHEEIIISSCNEIVNMLEDQELVSFLEQEIQCHTNMKEKLMSKLEEKAND